MDVIFRYPDGRTGQTSEEGFSAYHEEFGAEITAYVGARGESYPATDEGRAMAEGSEPNELTAYSRQVEALQARDNADRARADGDVSTTDADLAEAAAIALAEEAAAAAKAEREAAEALAKEAAEAAALETEEKPAKGKGK